MIEQHHTYCAMCISRCGVIATVDDGVLKSVNIDPAHPNGCICVKGTAAPEIVYSPDRLRYPMKRTRPKGDKDPGWVRISWDEAMATIASRLLEVKAKYGPESVVFGMGTPSASSISDAARWLDRLQYPAEPNSNIGKDFHCSRWATTAETTCACSMEEHAFPEGRRIRSKGLVDRGHEVRRSHRQTRIPHRRHLRI